MEDSQSMNQKVQGLKDELEGLKRQLMEQAQTLKERNQELRRTNEDLQRMNQLKSDLVSMVSHELRTPLTTIREFTAILSDQIAGPLTDAQREYLGIISGNVERLGRIITNLLDMAKIEAGRIFLNRAFLTVAPIIEHVISTVKPLAQSKGIELVTEIDSAAPSTFADEDKVIQVLLNLVGNALKFTPAKGKVSVHVKEVDGELQLTVKDTGIGITPEDLPNIFKKFETLRRPNRTSSEESTGLGLAISKRLVELHGGRIWVESLPRKGSAFTFTLPIHNVEEVMREYLHNGLEQAKRRKEHLALLLLSVPNYQELHGLYGAEEADRLVREVSRVLRDSIRLLAGDFVIQWKGGHLAMILADVDQATTSAVSQRLTMRIQRRSHTIQGKSIPLDINVQKCVYFPEDGDTPETLLSQLEGAKGPIAGRKRIMVIDDEPKMRKLIKEALQLREYDVCTAASGPEALELLKSNGVNLILLDLVMPVMDGYEVYHLLRENEETRDIPVVIVTAKGERKDRKLGLAMTSYNYLTKPFQMEDLFAKVQEALQRASKG